MSFPLYIAQEKGYPFIFDNNSVVLYGTITTISADNPASCALGGFKESTSAYRLCRQCMATREDAAKKVYNVVCVCMCMGQIICIYNVQVMHQPAM